MGANLHRPPPTGALAEMMARDSEREGAPFGGFAGELAPPPEPTPQPLPAPIVPPPPWAVEPGLREDAESYPARRSRKDDDAC